MERLASAVNTMSKSEVLTEYAKGIAYADKCGFDFHDDVAHAALRMAGLTPSETSIRGMYQDEVADGLKTVALLTTGNDNRVVCEMAWSGYGPNRVTLPGLVSKK